MQSINSGFSPLLALQIQARLQSRQCKTRVIFVSIVGESPQLMLYFHFSRIRNVQRWILAISLVSLVNWKVLGRTSMLVARSSLSRLSVEMLNRTWSLSSKVTLDLVSLSPKGSSLGITKSTLMRPGNGSLWGHKSQGKLSSPARLSTAAKAQGFLPNPAGLRLCSISTTPHLELAQCKVAFGALGWFEGFF